MNLKPLFLCITLASCSCRTMAPADAEPIDPPTESPIVSYTSPPELEVAIEPKIGGYVMMSLYGPVSPESVMPLMASLVFETRVDGFVIEINSGGGDVDAGFALVKAIENASAPVHCIVDGEAMSMAFYILQSCTTRSMTKRSVLMIHNPSVSGRMNGGALEFQELADRLLALQNAMMEQYLTKMNITKKQQQNKITAKDWYLGWEEAKSTQAVDFALTSVEQVWLVIAAHREQK